MRRAERISDATGNCAVIPRASLLNNQHKHVANVKQTHVEEIKFTDVVENKLLLACVYVTGFNINHQHIYMLLEGFQVLSRKYSRLT